MKIKIVLLAFLLIGTVLPLELVAQTPANPNLTRVRLLLAIIEDCNNEIKNGQAEVDAYNKITSQASLELYQQLKKNVEIAKKCKRASQKQYDDLRADYEGWFSSTETINIDNERISAAFLESYWGQYFTAYLQYMKMYNAIHVPEH